jgi:hypothetical protein
MNVKAAGISGRFGYADCLKSKIRCFYVQIKRECKLFKLLISIYLSDSVFCTFMPCDSIFIKSFSCFLSKLTEMVSP